MQRPLSLILILPLIACQGPTPQASRSVFMDNCASCHGVDATGNGPAANALPVPVPDLTTLSARNGGSFPWASVMTQIDGYTRRGAQNDPMPEFGNLLSGETVPFDSGDGIATPTPVELVEMATFLEGLQK